MPKSLNERTMGELGVMRDVLTVARRDMQQPAGEREIKRTILRLIDVLDAIVTDAPLSRTVRETDAVSYRPKGRS